MTVSWAGGLATAAAGAAESRVARLPDVVEVVVESQAARLPDNVEVVEPCSMVDVEAQGASVVTSMVLRNLLTRFLCASQAVWLKCTSCPRRLT